MPFERQPSPLIVVFTTIYLAALAWLVGMTAGIFAQSAWFAITATTLEEGDPTPTGAFITFAVASQLTFIIVSVALVCFIPTSKPRATQDQITQGLRLGAPRLRLWMWPLVIASNLFVWGATQWIFLKFFTEPGEHLEDLGNQIQSIESPTTAALTLIAVGLLPGLGEEAIYRGFVFKRLAAALHPGLVVFIVSLLFAASHVNLQQAVLIFPLGLWWTIISWRAKSVWPAVALHTLNNSWTLFMAWGLADIITDLPHLTLNIIIAVTAAAFFGSVVALIGPGIKPTKT